MHKADGQQWLVTGANGNLGRRFIATLSHSGSYLRRSAQRRAAKQLAAIELTAEQNARLDVAVLDYTDQPALLEAAQGCTRALHLVGILKATKSATMLRPTKQAPGYGQSVRRTSVEHLTYLSILGSSAVSSMPVWLERPC